MTTQHYTNRKSRIRIHHSHQSMFPRRPPRSFRSQRRISDSSPLNRVKIALESTVALEIFYTLFY
jgi:hypothetical protein